MRAIEGKSELQLGRDGQDPGPGPRVVGSWLSEPTMCVKCELVRSVSSSASALRANMTGFVTERKSGNKAGAPFTRGEVFISPKLHSKPENLEQIVRPLAVFYKGCYLSPLIGTHWDRFKARPRSVAK